MPNKIRIALDVLVIVACVLIAIFFIVEWINKGFPLYGSDGILGSRKTIIPLLGVSINICSSWLYCLYGFLYKYEQEK